MDGIRSLLCDRLVDLQETTRASVEDGREIGRRLRPEPLDDLGLPSAGQRMSAPLRT